MSFSELIRQRYSVRKFSSRPIEDDKLMQILEAGRLAPTGVNYQPQRILVLRGGELADLRSFTPCIFGQTAALVICYDQTQSWKSRSGHDIGEIDATIVMTQMMYQAQELGIGSVMVGIYKEPVLRQRFCIPDHYRIVCMLMLGYPAQDCLPHPELHSNRKPLSETVFFGTFPADES